MSAQQPDLDAFFEPNTSVKRRRGFTVFMIVVIVLVVVLAVLAVVAEVVARNYAEERAEKEIESSLPAGSTGTVDVKIHGLSVILQALGGSLQDVTLTSHNLVVQKVPLRFTADLSDVPLKSGGTTGPVDATIRVDQAALNTTKAVTDLGGAVVLGSGDFRFDKTFTLLGQQVKANVTATPELSSDGTKLTVTPTSATVNGAALPGYLRPLLSTAAQTICVAQYVPSRADLTSVVVAPSGVTLHLHSKGLPLTKEGLTGTGSCS